MAARDHRDASSACTAHSPLLRPARNKEKRRRCGARRRRSASAGVCRLPRREPSDSKRTAHRRHEALLGQQGQEVNGRGDLAAAHCTMSEAEAGWGDELRFRRQV